MTKTLDNGTNDPTDELIRAIQMANDDMDGKPVDVDVTAFHRRRLDIAALRSHLGLSQEAFAAQFGVSVGTVRNWEQGRRSPSGAARILLEVIDEAPEVVRAILARRVEHYEIKDGVRRPLESPVE